LSDLEPEVVEALSFMNDTNVIRDGDAALVLEA